MLSFNFQSSQNFQPFKLGFLKNVDSAELKLFRKWFSVNPREATAAVAIIKDNFLPKFLAEQQKASLKKHVDPEFTLSKSRWMLASEVSSPTFFENKYGFKESDVQSPPLWINQGLVTRALNSPQLQFARGFKTRRASSGGRIMGQNVKSGDERPAAKDAPPASDNASYMAGYEAGKVAERSGSTGAKGGGNKWNFWSTVQKTSSVLVIIALVIGLSQFVNIGPIRISRGGNEIAPEDIDVTFNDVKGCDEAKKELEEIVDFLMNPEKFSALGGRLPKGCLLTGPPGTGKTLLARAIAGQANVPFFHAAGSEFDEVLVGQGARRVRELFKAAKSRAPCVVFIDEIDTVGAKRSSSALHPYANQTINQLLTEMDGFLTNEGVIVLGATNRLDQLDTALLRPGRFDTQVEVPAPDLKGRKEILALYMGKIKHDSSVNLEKLAKRTVGFTGADLENLVNTAALRAATEGKQWVSMAEFEYSHDKHVFGTDWKSRFRDKEDLKITAYHEAGHTLVAFFTNDATPLHKVTIAAKGMSGGHTAFLPEKDSYHQTKSQLLATMDVGMGGRAAEELIFGKEKVTGGASNDLQGATRIAEAMTKSLGMSEKLGLRIISDNELSQQTTEIIDGEVTRLLTTSYGRAMAILKAHKQELDLLAESLLKYETLDAEDVKAIIEGNTKQVAQKMASSNQYLGMNKTRGVKVPGSNTAPGGLDALA